MKLFHTRDRHEFRPLLVEIDERPVNPLGRALLWTLLAAMIFGGAWLYFAKIDVVVSARGIVVPRGEVKVVQPIETGVVSRILVKEGSRVKKGELLMEIDPQVTESDLDAKKRRLALLRLETGRLEALAGGRPFVPEGSLLPAEVLKNQLSLYEAAKRGQEEKLASIGEQLQQAREQKASVEADLVRLQSRLELQETRRKRLEKVLDIIAAQEYDEVLQNIGDLKGQIAMKRHERAQLQARIRELGKQKSVVIQEFRNRLLDDLTARRKEAMELRAQIDAIGFKNAKQRLLSPVDGYVATLAVHTVGGVVTPAEKLLTIVPEGAPLLVKAQVLNKDIGFVKKGMETEIKVDTYDFQKYGLLRGEVIHISDDAVVDEKLGPVYEVYVRPEKDYLTHKGEKLPIHAGMSVTAEFKVGKRRVIEFFVYPIVKYLDEGMSVR